MEPIKPFCAIKYYFKPTKCSTCGTSLKQINTSYLKSNNQASTCIHLYCSKCDRNYIDDLVANIISENGHNPNVTINEPEKVKTNEKAIVGKKSQTLIEVSSTYQLKVAETPVYFYTGKLKLCNKCNVRLNSKKICFINKKGQNKSITLLKCPTCGSYYLHRNNYTQSVHRYIEESPEECPFKRVFDNPINLCTANKEKKNPKKNSIPHISIKEYQEKFEKKNNDIMHKSVDNSQKTNYKFDDFDDVIVYKNINNSCKKHHSEYVIQKRLILKKLSTNATKEVYGFYCEKCKKSFITVEVISKNISQRYIPNFRCQLSNEFAGNLKTKTALNLYGYTVQDGVLSVRERHAIIDLVIDHHIMTAMEIISLLQFLIKFRGTTASMQEACDKWRDDIRYIQSIRK